MKSTPAVSPGEARPQTVDGWARALFEGIDDAVFVHDLQGRIVDANPAACRRLGYTREEMLLLRTKDIDDPEFAAGFEDRLGYQLAEGRFRCEGRHRAKDGRLILVDINTSAIEFNGRPCVLAVMRDVTQRKLAEQTLRKQTELLRSVLGNMGDAVLAVDDQSGLLVCNPAASRLFGLSEGSETGLPGNHLPGLFLSDQLTPLAAVDSPLVRSLRGEHVDDVEVFVQPPGKAEGRWASITGRPLRDEQGAVKGGVIVCHDVTERKWAERRQAAQYAVARVLAGAGTLAEVGADLLRILGESLDRDLTALWVLDRQVGGLRCLALWQRSALTGGAGVAALQGTIWARGEGLPGRVWDTGEAVWEADLAAEGAPYLPLVEAGLSSAFAFPISGRGEITGVLEACGRVPGKADELHAVATSLGSQLGQLMDRERVEQELQESQAFYHSLVENLPQNIFRKDRDGCLTFANQRYCSVLHRPLKDLIGKTDFDLFPAELARKYRDDDARVLASGAAWETVEAHTLPDGSGIYVQVIKTPIRDDQGNIIGTQGMFWDVTERKRAEEALARSERRYRQLMESTLDAIVVGDQDGHIQLFNSAAERLFGYASAEVIGQPITILMADEYRQRHDTGLRRYVRTRAPQVVGRVVELHGRHKDGTVFPVELALSAIELTGEGGPGRLQFLGALRDLTERNRIRSALVQNEKLASIGLLSAGVAHEINNPLAFIGNNLAVLERDSKGIMALLELYESRRDRLAEVDPEAAAKAAALSDEMDVAYVRDNLTRLLSRTRDGVDRVTRIVHSLRGLARTDKPQMQETSLPDLVAMGLEIIRGRLKRSGVRVEEDYDANPSVRCVSTQISQVLLNLMLNALQAIEAAGRTEGGLITVRARRRRDQMVIEVTDNGCGIDAQHVPRLFDPFFTTKEVGEGTGLGLSISHNIVTAHGGVLEVDSTLGQGSTFRIYLPLGPGRTSL